MGQGQALTTNQMTAIRTLLNEDKSYQYIANIIGKSKNAVFNYAKRLREGRRKVKTRTESSISPQFCRAIILETHLSHDERVKASSLVSKYNPAIGVRRVHQLLLALSQVEWARMRPAPRLTDHHRSKESLGLKKD